MPNQRRASSKAACRNRPGWWEPVSTILQCPRCDTTLAQPHPRASVADSRPTTSRCGCNDIWTLAPSVCIQPFLKNGPPMRSLIFKRQQSIEIILSDYSQRPAARSCRSNLPRLLLRICKGGVSRCRQFLESQDTVHSPITFDIL